MCYTVGPCWLSILDTHRNLGVVLRAGLREFAWRMSREIEGFLTGLLEAKGFWMCFRGRGPQPFKVVMEMYIHTCGEAFTGFSKRFMTPKRLKPLKVLMLSRP